MKKNFFNKSLQFVKEHKLKKKKIIVAVSGGLDSVVMLDLLKELSLPCDLKLYVTYIHHGPSLKTVISNYRNKARLFVEQLALSYKLDFLCPPLSKKILKNEKELREFRHKNLNKLLKQKKADIIALAHNKNDQLETQLLQLIRGCAWEGLKSMPFWQKPYWRPLKKWSRKEIQSYAEQNKLQWREDPSNKNHQHFRNWVRNKWLPLLETKRKGSVKSLSRSLETLSYSENSEKKDSLKNFIDSRGIKKRAFMELPLQEQKRLLAFYMRKLKLSNYGQSHMGEILKLAERKEKNFSTRILKKTWVFSSKYIQCKQLKQTKKT